MWIICSVGSHHKLVHKSVFILEPTGSDFNYESHFLTSILCFLSNQRNSWVTKSTATASSSPSPSPLKPLSCSLTGSHCCSKDLEPSCQQTFPTSHCQMSTSASPHGAPSVSGSSRRASGCRSAAVCTRCF